MRFVAAAAAELHPLDVAAKIVGGRSVMARALGVTESAIGNWKRRGIPIEQCVPIWRMTDGRVTRQNLRPDDWAEIWPELAVSQISKPNLPQANAAPAHAATDSIVESPKREGAHV